MGADAGFAGMACFCLLPMILLAVLGTAFWIWMLVDCLMNEPSEGNDKVIWALVILLANLLGAAL